MTSLLRRLALGVAILLGSSCAGSGTPGAQSTPFTTASSPTVSIETPTSKGVAPKPLVVHIRGFAYVPAAPVVIVGQPIEIINDDAAAHTWSAAPKSGWVYTSGNLDKGQRVTFPGFTEPGSHRFLCYYHAEMPSMNGVVTVRAAPQR
jgi:plastocyanin